MQILNSQYFVDMQSHVGAKMNNINIHNPYYLWNILTMDYVTTSSKTYNYETDGMAARWISFCFGAARLVDWPVQQVSRFWILVDDKFWGFGRVLPRWPHSR